MILFLRLSISLGLALIANLFMELASRAEQISLDPLTIAIIFVACFSMALISPALKPIRRSNNNNNSNTNTDKNRSTPHSGNREQGTVKWFNVSKGYGFVTRQSGEDIFVHFRSIRGDGRRALREGQLVEFVVIDGDKGPQAEEVEPVAGH